MTPEPPDGPHERNLMIDLLLVIAGGRGELSTEALAAELDVPAEEVARALGDIARYGLALPEHGGEPPMLLRAGEQFLARSGRVPSETLAFLGGRIDDLNAREALRRAGSVLVKDFVAAIADGQLVELTREILPPAFAQAATPALGARMFAAASALVSRLACDEPAGCVAEEIVAVRLIEIAEELLAENADLSEAERDEAAGALRALWDLFEDDDVLAMFEMHEPSDAALAGQSPISAMLGVADQRLEAWFEPFGWTVATGHLTGTDYRWP